MQNMLTYEQEIKTLLNDTLNSIKEFIVTEIVCTCKPTNNAIPYKVIYFYHNTLPNQC